ncbi:NAD+ kinase [Barrientosiimonas humi]|uniref:NAD kinase n=2 Tax=Barrientosiimonas TaxID=1535207 RepID=A0A542XC65_9MICO|nr:MULTISPECIES: NAD kinase [Barrientosiimonas]TQL33425.1 NAD+ kinase [Barrientosiimonas humi]BDZ58326.1 NAD kinase 2 [Barrientosiimonas endolithica]CAG7573413.1 NAD kinase [Barrientosiimonas humi]
MTRRILLVGHPGRPRAIEVARDLVEGLRANDIVVCGDPTELAEFGLLGADGVEPVEVSEPAPGTELTVVLGGDGTILRAAELVRESGIPLLGINLGHVGFLAEAEPDDIHHIVQGIVQRSWTVESRQTLEVLARVDGEIVCHSWALNEATVEKAARERMLELVVEIDGRPLSTWGCDGVVVSTPTGSTAYAFSAGGPVIWPGVEAMLVCPISAHALFARPLVLGPQARLAIEMVPRTEARGVLWFDGRRSFELPPGARVEARRSDRNVDLARLTPAPFVDRLVAKFDLPVQGWRGRGPR